MKAELVKNPAYKMIQEAGDGYAYRGIDGMVVIQSVAKESDGKEWLHTSFSRRSRMPSYDDMKRIREIFIPDDKKAIMVFPDKAHHVNIHPFCLHFFTPLEVDGLPEFSAMGSI